MLRKVESVCVCVERKEGKHTNWNGDIQRVQCTLLWGKVCDSLGGQRGEGGMCNETLVTYRPGPAVNGFVYIDCDSGSTWYLNSEGEEGREQGWREGGREEGDISLPKPVLIYPVPLSLKQGPILENATELALNGSDGAQEKGLIQPTLYSHSKT